MNKKPAVTIEEVGDIKALHLYCFDSAERSDSDWLEICDASFGHMNPEFGNKFVSGLIAAGFTNIKATSGVSKEQASLNIDNEMQTIAVPQLQAFVQVCEFALPQHPEAKTTIWLVSFICGAKSVVRPDQAQIVFVQAPIGTLSGASEPKKSWKFWK